CAPSSTESPSAGAGPAVGGVEAGAAWALPPRRWRSRSCSSRRVALAAAPVAAPAAPAVAAAPPAPPPKIELPSASAAYLNNPPPAYPALSRRLGEQGRVVLRVRIEPDGTASAAEIRTSSGYERLDKAALEAVLRWRYVPGKRDGVPEAMWFLVPIQFVLE
ncbi:energy transducer TonB, partial [Tepidimonas sediminis]|uniref:energy transducer TonB n=1 Tax=Tepidimonas sediminis TaxID=2588941 RepID=UPI00117C6035